jgi:hypothetical protein
VILADRTRDRTRRGLTPNGDRVYILSRGHPPVRRRHRALRYSARTALTERGLTLNDSRSGAPAVARHAPGSHREGAAGQRRRRSRTAFAREVQRLSGEEFAQALAGTEHFGWLFRILAKASLVMLEVPDGLPRTRVLKLSYRSRSSLISGPISRSEDHETRNPASLQVSLSAPERIRTSDLRFRSAPVEVYERPVNRTKTCSVAGERHIRDRPLATVDSRP